MVNSEIPNTKLGIYTERLVAGKILNTTITSEYVRAAELELLIDQTDRLITVGHPLLVETIRDILETIFSVTL